MTSKRGFAMIIVIVVVSVVGGLMLSELQSLPRRSFESQRAEMRMQTEFIARAALEQAADRWDARDFKRWVWMIPEGDLARPNWKARVEGEWIEGENATKSCRIRVEFWQGKRLVRTWQRTCHFPTPAKEGPDVEPRRSQPPS